MSTFGATHRGVLIRGMTLDVAFTQWLFPDQALGAVQLILDPHLPQLSIPARLQGRKVAKGDFLAKSCEHLLSYSGFNCPTRA